MGRKPCFCIKKARSLPRSLNADEILTQVKVSFWRWGPFGYTSQSTRDVLASRRFW